jgi:hypothetical protein
MVQKNAEELNVQRHERVKMASPVRANYRTQQL